MKNHRYLTWGLIGFIGLMSTSSFAQSLPDVSYQHPVTLSDLNENPQKAYEFHKEQVAFHKAMAELHKTLAEKYKNDGNYELHRHHKDLATQHEALSKENDRVAHIHEKNTNTL